MEQKACTSSSKVEWQLIHKAQLLFTVCFYGKLTYLCSQNPQTLS